ncbi:MAG: hypothetical protein QM493_09930 [Sulfurovum sp.]
MSKRVLFLLYITMAWSDTISLGFNKEDAFATTRDYGKCNYFVMKKGDLSRQNSCILIANSVLKGHSYRRASWYYLIGGDLGMAFDVATIGMDKGDYFSAETLAEIYLIRGDTKNAKKYFELFKENIEVDVGFLGDHLDILGRIYKDRFSVKRAKSLLGDNMFLINR